MSDQGRRSDKRVRAGEGSYLRDVSVQAMGTVVGGVVLLIGAKVAGLLGGVGWAQVWKATGVPVVILAVGFIGSWFLRPPESRAELIERAKREGWYDVDMEPLFPQFSRANIGQNLRRIGRYLREKLG